MGEPVVLQERMERDMLALRRQLRKMAARVLEQLEQAIVAFDEGNRKLAYRVVLQDHAIDVMEHHIDRMCQEFLVRHMPVSEQLRFVVAVAKVNSELERIGDYAEAIARRVVTISEAEAVPERARILEMAHVSNEMLHHATDAFLDSDAAMALRTLESDNQVDRMNTAIFESLAQPAEAPTDLIIRFALVGLINRIERVADRACNIAEETVYVVRGEVLRHLPREDMRVLFLCDHNSCRSQMAEGIARKMAPARFIFSSAGPEPQDLDPGAVAFLAAHDIDISRQRAKAVADVGRIEDFNIVVTLSRGAEDACPAVPYDAVQLNWDIKDPSNVRGGAEETQAAYEETFHKLCSKIQELTEGLVSAFEREDDE